MSDEITKVEEEIVKHPGGRPTLYNEGIIAKADEYLATCGREQTKLPKITEFYRYIGISPQCADEWKDKHPEFGEVCKKIEERQLEVLMDDGLYGGKEVNPGVAIFLMKAKHGLKDNSPQVMQQFNMGGKDKNTIVFVNYRNETGS